MARTKNATSGEGGNHLTIHRYDDGTVDMKWNWDALLKEVQIATGDRKVHYIDIGDMPPQEATKLIKKVTKVVTSKKDLVKETETKITKTRKPRASTKQG